MSLRHDWKLEELKELYDLPLIELVSKSHGIHIKHHSPNEIQTCTLISVKTGGCSEDCKYCAQSSRYQTNVSALPMMKVEDVLIEAKKAIARGATRICLGAAWRNVRHSKQFEQILEMVRSISSLGAEVCCTLGMLDDDQAKQLKNAGLHSYNHNLDSSEEFYNTIITTRSYQERLKTLQTLEQNGIRVCCGGIIGMGETTDDRLKLILNLCTRAIHPSSVPINRLYRNEGTPLQNLPEVSPWETLRMVAVARITMPKTMVRLSAGRSELSYEQQALCFLAGANSIHMGEKLLTVGNQAVDEDEEMFNLLGLKAKPISQKALTL